MRMELRYGGNYHGATCRDPNVFGWWDLAVSGEDEIPTHCTELLPMVTLYCQDSLMISWMQRTSRRSCDETNMVSSFGIQPVALLSPTPTLVLLTARRANASGAGNARNVRHGRTDLPKCTAMQPPGGSEFATNVCRITL